jgi:hypothetical protein
MRQDLNLASHTAQVARAYSRINAKSPPSDLNEQTKCSLTSTPKKCALVQIRNLTVGVIQDDMLLHKFCL